MAEKIKELMQEYRQGRITRREFMIKAVAITGSLAAANALINTLMSSKTEAAQVDTHDPTILWSNVQYEGKGGTIHGYLARPVAAGKYPAVIVIHGNTGLEDHFRDVARRFAKEGFVGLAPDYLSRHGGTAKANPKGEGLPKMRELVPWQTVAEDTGSGVEYLKILPDVRGDRIAVVGFCWGGEMTFAAATQLKNIKAAVVYYGRSPNPLDLVKNIRVPVLAHYGEKDPGVNKGIPDTEAAMKKYNKSYTYKIYPGAPHAFNQETLPDRYHAEAAKESWGRTLEFLRKNLKT